MIGEIHKILTPYYDSTSRIMRIKSRPGLIIAQADSDDYTVLPVSKVSIKQNIHPKYDVKVDPATYPDLHLNCVSFIRTHKITTIHQKEIGDFIGDLRNSYVDLYLDVLELQEDYSKSITDQAIS